jgi:hypothetical protein
MRSFRFAAFLIAFLVPIGAAAADPARQKILERIGQAVATDERIPFGGLEVVSTASVAAADEREWEKKIKAALSILYAPPDQPPRQLNYSALRDMMPVEMEGDRTPDRVVEDVISPGRIVALVKWKMGALLELDSFAVFEAERLLFDSVLSMPVIHEPVFSVPHL